MSKRGTEPPTCQLVQRADPLPNIIPAYGISLLSGAPNVGKTALLASFIKAFRDGTPIFGHRPSAVAGVTYIAADRHLSQGGGVWLERAGVAADSIRIYSMTDDPGFDPRTLRRKFERTLRLQEMIDRTQTPRGGLVFVDPLGLFLGGNLNDYDSCMVACHEIRTMLRQRELTLIGGAHSSKLKSDQRDRYVRLQDQILGSTALLGFSDTQMYLAAPEETGRKTYSFLWNSHMAPPEVFDLVRDAQGLFVPASIDTQGWKRVLGLFPESGAPVGIAELAESARSIPLTRRTIERVVQELIAERLVLKIRRGVYARTDLLPAEPTVN